MIIRLFSVICLVILIWSILPSDTAISGLLESRLNNLESEFYRLESQVSRIETQLNRAGVSSPKFPNNSSLSQTSPRILSQGKREQMFDRLATLVIESKQDIKDLKKRIYELENTNN